MIETDQPSYQTKSARQQMSELNVALNYDINTVNISVVVFIINN